MSKLIAEEVLRCEKHGCLLNHILYTELQELLLDYEIKSQEISVLSSIPQQCLTRARTEVGYYLDFSTDPSSKVTALGLTWEHLEGQNPERKHMESLQQVVISQVEERLRRKCEHLVVAHDLVNSSSDR